MKKVLAVLLAVLLCLSVFPISTYAVDEEFIVTAGGGTAARGGIITVPIVVEKNPGWRALDIRVSYDADVLEIQCPNHEDGKNCIDTRLPSITKLGKEDFAMAIKYNCKNYAAYGQYHTANPYPLQWAFSLINEDITEVGTYATITFVVKDDAAFGETKVDIEVPLITNCDNEHPTALVNDATINIVDKYVNTNIPCDPNLEKATATSVALVAAQGYEYSMDGTTWQSSNVFNNLAPNTEYTFYQRIAETDTHFASAVSEKLVVKTIKHNAADPVAPVEESKTATSVTLVAAQGYEYSMDGENWKTTNVFNNLAPGTTYTFYQRVAETDTHYASVVSTPLVVTTSKYNNVAFPIAPVEKSKTATSVTLVAVEGYEYSMDGETWQTSNVFENLAPNTEYTFYQMVAETDTHYASVVSAPLVVKTIKHTASTPISPVIASKEATVIVLAAQQGYEYSIDGEAWQISNVFENLTPGTTYTFYQRVAETATHYASETSVGTTCTTLKLQQTAPVAPVVLRVEATTVTLLAKEGYEYSLDGETWQTSNVFENLAPNTEYTLYQRKAETNTHYASVPSAPLVVKTIKHTAENPVAPEGLEITATTVTLVAMEGYEYSLDGETWQTSNVFENLAPNTEYTFYQRSAETDTHYASAVSEKLVVKTIKHNTAAPVTPVVKSKTATSVTLVAMDGYEYSLDGETWQTSNVFENLAPNTEYTFYQRIAETNTHYASAVSEKLVVKTIKHNAADPVTPVEESKTATSVTLVAVEGYEYSMDGENWQTSNVFNNLDPNTEYTFYQRIAETNTHYVSAVSEKLVVKTIKHNAFAPNQPVVASKDATVVVLVSQSGCEYSLDGENWQTSNVFENLAPGTTYTFYQRVAETGTHYASKASGGTTCTTLKLQQTAPVAPVASMVEATTVTLVAKEGYEYSLDGEIWQTSNVFENLAPNTEYTFYQRKAETDTHYASVPSTPLVVKTIKHTAETPVAPETLEITATTVTLVAMDGYEYSLDGEDWQTSNVFETLAPNTEYTFYQRKAETNTHYASVLSAPLVVKTIKHTAENPIAPETLEITATTVTLVAMDGYEYSLDGETWQSSNVFKNLAPNTEYSFYQRKAETETYYASEISAKLVANTYISGNVNNDDEVTLDDVVLLAQYVAGWDVELNLNVSDVNGDTDITLDDVVLLAQFVAGWDVTLN